MRRRDWRDQFQRRPSGHGLVGHGVCHDGPVVQPRHAHLEVEAGGALGGTSAPGMLENFGSEFGKPQIARRAFEQANAKLILKLGDAAADGGDRHF